MIFFTSDFGPNKCEEKHALREVLETELTSNQYLAIRFELTCYCWISWLEDYPPQTTHQEYTELYKVVDH